VKLRKNVTEFSFLSNMIPDWLIERSALTLTNATIHNVNLLPIEGHSEHLSIHLNLFQN
jgi:hypothetical protein